MATGKREGDKVILELSAEEAMDLSLFIREGGSYWMQRVTREDHRGPDTVKFLRNMAKRAFAWAEMPLIEDGVGIDFYPELDQEGR